MGVATVMELKQSISGKRTFRPSLSSRHANEWPPTDVSSDLTVEVGSSSFALHKFPLVSRSGKIRRLVAEAKDGKVSRLRLDGTPGGAAAFELAAKFCYGVAVDITASNVAMLLCAARHLQMTEAFSDHNLELRAEAFLRDAVLPSAASAVAALRGCEALMPAAEELGLVARLIAAIATTVCREQLASELSKLEQSAQPKAPTVVVELDPPGDWWGKAVAGLGVDLFHRLLSAAKSKGLKQETVTRILITYAQSSLHGLMAGAGAGAGDAEAAKKQRAVVEAVVGLLPAPSKKSPVPMAFLSGLLKAAAAAAASSTCTADLERRIGMQLEQAILEDILVPAESAGYHRRHDALYDTDVVARVVAAFLDRGGEEEEEEGEGEGEGGYGGYESARSSSPAKQRSLVRVGKLLDSYLAEVALDSSLTAAKFTALAELLPDHARLVTDGLYRAVDIFLKVHPSLKESERYRLCKTIDCQKLSPDACSHAAQNDRLPVQMAVQVLYFEQTRLRHALAAGAATHDHLFFAAAAAAASSSTCPHRSGSAVGSGAISPRDNYASVRRENRELKLEVARMRMRLTDLEKDHVSMRKELVRAAPANRLLHSFARSLGKLGALFRAPRDRHGKAPPLGARAVAADAKLLFHRRRRHSIS